MYTYYNYEYLRSETTFDIQSKYVYRLQQEIYVHMFDFSNYAYYEDFEGRYIYYGDGFTSSVKFQGGYLTCLTYVFGSNYYEIRLLFETTIEIPEFYYYA